MPDGAAGFFSYVQADDESDGGRIISLSKHLRAQFRIQTADELSLFVDRESLEWGSEWAARIDEAIAGTTFFIPVITPSYFRSQTCRQELLKFTREATRLGLEQLLMPIYWVGVADLDNDPASSADEAVRLVSRYQWQDFRDVRLEDEDSAVFRKAVSGLAAELASRAAKVTSTVQDMPEAAVATPLPSAPSGDPDDEPGILEKLAAAEEAMPQLSEILDEIRHRIEQVGELVQESGQRMQTADARGQGMKARLVITERLAKALAKPTAEIEDFGHQYAELLATLDPGMHATLDIAASDETATEAPAEFLHVVQSLAVNADEALSQFYELVESSKEAAKFSRSLRTPLGRMRTGLQGVLDGRAIIEEWGRRARSIEADLEDRAA